MSTPAFSQSTFNRNLKKYYTFYTGGFIVFLLALAVAEQLGLSRAWIGYWFLFATIALYAGIGWMTRTQDVAEYYVAGRRVPSFFNGMATGADWMSAASFIGMAGTLFLSGYDGLAWVMGWTGGFCLVALFLAPYLRKFGQFTIPDFLAERYGGNIVRFMGVICAITCSFVYVVAQIYGVGLIVSRMTGLEFGIGVFVGLAGILVCAMLGGMRAVTWTQVAQYIVLIIAYMTPVVWPGVKHTGIPGPQFRYGGAGAHPDALLHHAQRAGGAHLGVLVAGVHLPVVLHGALPCGAGEVRHVHQPGGQFVRRAPGLGLGMGEGGSIAAQHRRYQQGRHRAAGGNRDRRRSDRTGDARDRGPAVRRVRPGCGRWPGGGAVYRGRVAADHCQRPGARFLLQADRPDSDHRAARVPLQIPIGLRRNHSGLRDFAQARGHPVPRRRGVLAGGVLVLPLPGDGHLLEARQQVGSDRRHGRRAWNLRVLHGYALPVLRHQYAALVWVKPGVGGHVRPAGVDGHDLCRELADPRAGERGAGAGRARALPEPGGRYPDQRSPIASGR